MRAKYSVSIFTTAGSKSETLYVIFSPGFLLLIERVRDLFSTLLTLLLMVFFAYGFLTYIGQRVAVEGGSMEDTLHNNDQLIVDCLTYRFIHEPQRFDIVVFRLKDSPDTFYVKRLIGLPGETVLIKDSVIYINGKAIDDPYATQKQFSAGTAAFPITLGEDEFFVMGDNRVNSIDSRYEVGAVKRSQLVGRAWMRIYNFDTRTKLTVGEEK